MKWVTLTLIGVLFLIFGYFVFPWLAILIGGQLQPNPPRPEITYGEFPFRLEYEINGQRKVIEDTLICEFDGFGWNEGVGKHRKWKERLASGNERVTLLKIDEKKEIYYSPGNAKYYLGDLGDSVEFKHSFPNASIEEKDDRGIYDRTIGADELLELYNIKLISWEPSPPIKNSFK